MLAHETGGAVDLLRRFHRAGAGHDHEAVAADQQVAHPHQGVLAARGALGQLVMFGPGRRRPPPARAPPECPPPRTLPDSAVPRLRVPARPPRRGRRCAGPPTGAGWSAGHPARHRRSPPCRRSPSSPPPNSAGQTARRTSPPSAATPSRSARSSPAAGLERLSAPVHVQTAVPRVPAHPAPHRRRAAALRRTLRAARAQGRPDRRARPVRDPRGLLARGRRTRDRTDRSTAPAPAQAPAPTPAQVPAPVEDAPVAE